MDDDDMKVEEDERDDGMYLKNVEMEEDGNDESM